MQISEELIKQITNAVLSEDGAGDWITYIFRGAFYGRAGQDQ